MIVYKTASQMGTNDVFEQFSDYTAHQATTNNDAHRIIDTDVVPELVGSFLDVEVDGWGNKKVIVNSEEFTVPQFFARYQQ